MPWARWACGTGARDRGATGTWDRPVVAGRADVGPLTFTPRTIDRAELRYRLASSEGFSRWTGTLETPRVVLPGVPIEGLRAAVVLDAERVEVQPLTARVRGIPLTLRGTWDWGGRRTGGGGPRAGRARRVARTSRQRLAGGIR